MKILIASPLPSVAIHELRSLGAEVLSEPSLSADELPARLSDANVLVVGRTRVSNTALESARHLQLIVRTGADVSSIAIEEASAQGVFVAHVPSMDAIAVAEMALALMLALDRGLVDAALASREGRKRPDLGDARGLAGRTLGILGSGLAAQLLARRAQALEMRVLCWSPALTQPRAAEMGAEFCTWPRELARKSDVVAVLAPPESGGEQTVDAEFVQNMRDASYLVHIGHPAAIDESALADAISKRRIRVASDAYSAEPMSETQRARSALAALPGVIATSRLAGATQQAREAIAAEVVRIVRAFLVSGEIHNCVNLCERSPATWQLMMRVRDQPGVMAAIMDVIRADGINAEEISSRVFLGAKAAWCTIALDERPSSEALESMRGMDNVLHLELRAVV
ncbi:MAG: NAD(P)-dependent oxidoreductase [Phycisphaerae bacterium]